MKPESLLPHLQERTTYHYPEPDQSSPHIFPISWESILILSFHLILGTGEVTVLWEYDKILDFIDINKGEK